MDNREIRLRLTTALIDNCSPQTAMKPRIGEMIKARVSELEAFVLESQSKEVPKAKQASGGSGKKARTQAEGTRSTSGQQAADKSEASSPLE